MPFTIVDSDTLYERDPNLKKEDIRALEEWNQKQPHLPTLKETQLMLFLQSCYYRSEAAKAAIENYFTVKTICPELFSSLDKDTFQNSSSVGFINILPKKNMDDYIVIFMSLLDLKSENFNWTTQINNLHMVSMLHLHQKGFEKGVVALFDMKGFTLAHLARMNLMVMKKALYLLQEGAPVRLKSVHFINVVPYMDKIIGMIRPFLKAELVNMLHFHSNTIETLYQHVPKKCLPKEYGGDAAPISDLNENSLRNVLDNYDFFKWFDDQIVDESKRLEKMKNVGSIFGVEGTFKKLELD